MATTASSADAANEVKTLNALRQRLSTLTGLLYGLRRSIDDPTAPLPPRWDELTGACDDLARNLSRLQDFLHDTRAFEHDDLGIAGYDVPRFLAAAHVHPTGAFPRASENALGVLLAGKLAPAVEEWVDGAVRAAREADERAAAGDAGALSAEQLQNLWLDVFIETQERAARLGDRPQEEGSDEGSDDEEDEDEQMEEADAAASGGAAVPAVPSRPMMKLEDVLRFTCTGTVR